MKFIASPADSSWMFLYLHELLRKWPSARSNLFLPQWTSVQAWRRWQNALNIPPSRNSWITAPRATLSESTFARGIWPKVAQCLDHAFIHIATQWGSALHVGSASVLGLAQRDRAQKLWWERVFCSRCLPHAKAVFSCVFHSSQANLANCFMPAPRSVFLWMLRHSIWLLDVNPHIPEVGMPETRHDEWKSVLPFPSFFPSGESQEGKPPISPRFWCTSIFTYHPN